MSVFSETTAKAIADYRQILRRYLSQSERQEKIEQLRLRDPNIYNSEVALYHTAHAIVKDIEKNIETPNQGYYAYNGIEQFCSFLKEFLDCYELKSGAVLHKAQRASRAFVYAVQIFALPKNRLQENHAEQMLQYNSTIAEFGTDEQHDLYLENLQEQLESNPEFYQSILQDFLRRLQSSGAPG